MPSTELEFFLAEGLFLNHVKSIKSWTKESVYGSGISYQILFSPHFFSVFLEIGRGYLDFYQCCLFYSRIFLLRGIDRFFLHADGRHPINMNQQIYAN